MARSKNNSVQVRIRLTQLATQIYNNAKLFTKYNSEIKVSLIVGGNDQKTVNKLAVQPHVVIGTPGRIKDLSLDEQALKLQLLQLLLLMKLI
ncbi:MAG: DEAD/DEAH box helicase [Streptococcus sp.]